MRTITTCPVSFAGASPSLWTGACLLLSLSGCFGMTSEGRRMRHQVDDSATRLQKLEIAQNAQLEQLKGAEARAQQKVSELEGVIERATSVVQRNSADVTVQVSELQSKVAALEGKLAELQYAIDELKKGGAVPASTAPVGATPAGAGAAPTGASTPTTPEAPRADAAPADKKEHYAAAYRAYTQRDFTKARTLFRSYIEKYGTDEQADNAQYWLGASYLIENRPATALAELKKVIQNFRGSDAIDESLLDMAEAFYRLRACSDSRNALDTLIRTQPSSPLAPKAKQKLKDLKKLDKDYCTS
ncbi:MAG: tetratricopeptide repeat protein [Polyangiales bacterium]